MHRNSSQTGLFNNDWVTLKSVLANVSYIKFNIRNILKFHLINCATQKGEKYPKHWGILLPLKEDQINLSHGSSICLYMKISLSFYLQVSCKYTYFTFTSSNAHPREGNKKTPTLSKVGSAPTGVYQELQTKFLSHISAATCYSPHLWHRQHGSGILSYWKLKIPSAMGKGKSIMWKYSPTFSTLSPEVTEVNRL